MSSGTANKSDDTTAANPAATPLAKETFLVASMLRPTGAARTRTSHLQVQTATMRRYMQVRQLPRNQLENAKVVRTRAKVLGSGRVE